jgi:hypothetical protein
VVHDMALYSSSYVLFLNHTVVDSSVIGNSWPTLETRLPILSGRLLSNCYTPTRAARWATRQRRARGRCVLGILSERPL